MKLITEIVFSQNTVLVPDYEKPRTIIAEHGSYANGVRNYYPRWHGGPGNDLSSHLDQQYWTLNPKTNYTDIGTYFTYTIPQPGYIQIGANFDMNEYYNTDTSLLPNQISFRAGIRRSQFSVTEVFSFTTNKTTALYKSSDIIPVAKGDVIYWGTWRKGDGVPAEYGITFYSAKSVDAKTGD